MLLCPFLKTQLWRVSSALRLWPNDPWNGAPYLAPPAFPLCTATARTVCLRADTFTHNPPIDLCGRGRLRNYREIPRFGLAWYPHAGECQDCANTGRHDVHSLESN